jgi:hypothetical protein
MFYPLLLVWPLCVNPSVLVQHSSCYIPLMIEFLLIYWSKLKRKRNFFIKIFLTSFWALFNSWKNL